MQKIAAECRDFSGFKTRLELYGDDFFDTDLRRIHADFLKKGGFVRFWDGNAVNVVFLGTIPDTKLRPNDAKLVQNVAKVFQNLTIFNQNGAIFVPYETADSADFTGLRKLNHRAAVLEFKDFKLFLASIEFDSLPSH